MPKYIDADALKEAFLFECKDVCDDTDEFDTKWGASQELIEKVIDFAPAADVEPVRHGRWIINEINDDIRVLMCSCGFHEKRSTDLRIPRYCEQCGAKMNKEEGRE